MGTRDQDRSISDPHATNYIRTVRDTSRIYHIQLNGAEQSDPQHTWTRERRVMRHESDTLTGFIVAALLLLAVILSIAINKVAIVPEEPTVTWITTIPTNTPVDAGAKKLNLEIGIRADGVLVGALSTIASATTNIKGEQTP